MQTGPKSWCVRGIGGWMRSVCTTLPCVTVLPLFAVWLTAYSASYDGRRDRIVCYSDVNGYEYLDKKFLIRYYNEFKNLTFLNTNNFFLESNFISICHIHSMHRECTTVRKTCLK